MRRPRNFFLHAWTFLFAGAAAAGSVWLQTAAAGWHVANPVFSFGVLALTIAAGCALRAEVEG